MVISTENENKINGKAKRKQQILTSRFVNIDDELLFKWYGWCRLTRFFMYEFSWVMSGDVVWRSSGDSLDVDGVIGKLSRSLSKSSNEKSSIDGVGISSLAVIAAGAAVDDDDGVCNVLIRIVGKQLVNWMKFVWDLLELLGAWM